jgi:hypothetical protein
MSYSIDLHTHTTASDGIYTPSQLVEQAVQRGVHVLGIADHDTVDGLVEAQTAGERLGVEIVPAIEFSTRHEHAKQFVGIHLLGYFVDPKNPTLLEIVEKVRQGRVEQKIRQIEKMQSFGFDIKVEDVFAKAKGVPGRPHIAATLREQYPDKFTSSQQIYDEYLGSNAKAHVGRVFALTVREVIEVVKQVGGLPVLAHPAAYGLKIDPITIIRNAKAEGVEGVEVWYPYDDGHRPYDTSGSDSWVTQISQLADELGLLKTGGTDFHGRSHETINLGDSGLTKAQFEILKQGWQLLRK